MSFKIEGLRELEAQLERLKPATGKAALRRAGIKAMKPMADLARRFAPEKTGELKGSIMVSAKAQGAGADIGKNEYSAVIRTAAQAAKAAGQDFDRASVIPEARAALRNARREAKVSSNAASVELFMGPSKAKTKADAIKRIVQEFGSRKMRANPYMRPAWDMDKERLLERVTAQMRTEIEKTVARAAKRGALLK